MAGIVSGQEASGITAGAGEDLSSAEVFTPFVSNIQTEVVENRIRITWTDIPGYDDISYNIYRSNKEINAGNISSAELRANIPAGTGIYQDLIPVNGPYYYAVVTVDEDGSELPIFIPFRNKTVLATVITDLKSLAAESGIEGLEALAQSDRIILSFSSATSDRLALYRSTSPITDSAGLSGAIQIDTLPPTQTQYSDYVIPGIPYYYAVLDLENLNSASPALVQGQNSLSSPVEVPLGSRYPGFTRDNADSAVLPLLILQQSVLNGRQLPSTSVDIPQKQQLSLTTRSDVDALLAPIDIPRNPPPQPDILATERSSDGEKDQNQVLYRIVSESFTLGNYELSARQLGKLLTISLNDDLEYRTRYYYAQSLYFAGEYQQAFLQFLLIRDRDYARINPWMDSALRKLSDISR